MRALKFIATAFWTLIFIMHFTAEANANPLACFKNFRSDFAVALDSVPRDAGQEFTLRRNLEAMFLAKFGSNNDGSISHMYLIQDGSVQVPGNSAWTDVYPSRSGALIDARVLGAMVDYLFLTATTPETPRYIPQEMKNVLNALKNFIDQGGASARAALEGRLNDIMVRPRITISGVEYFIDAPQIALNTNLRLATEADYLTAGYRMRTNGLTGQIVLDGVQSHSGARFADIMSDTTVYSGGGTTSYARNRARADGAEAIIVNELGMIRGIYRGSHSPARTRGMTTDLLLSRSRSFSDVGSIHFIESRTGRVIAIPSTPGMRLFTVDRPRG